MNTVERCAAASIAVASLAFSIGPAGAADKAAEIYKQFHGAAEAAQMCNDVEFTQEDWYRLEASVREKIGTPVHNALMLIEEGESSAADLVRTEGCDSPDVKALMAPYKSELGQIVDIPEEE